MPGSHPTIWIFYYAKLDENLAWIARGPGPATQQKKQSKMSSLIKTLLGAEDWGRCILETFRGHLKGAMTSSWSGLDTHTFLFCMICACVRQPITSKGWLLIYIILFWLYDEWYVYGCVYCVPIMGMMVHHGSSSLLQRGWQSYRTTGLP